MIADNVPINVLSFSSFILCFLKKYPHNPAFPSPNDKEKRLIPNGINKSGMKYAIIEKIIDTTQ